MFLQGTINLRCISGAKRKALVNACAVWHAGNDGRHKGFPPARYRLTFENWSNGELRRYLKRRNPNALAKIYGREIKGDSGKL